METTQDAFLGGRVQVLQPKTGYRAGVDPVFLAASCPAKPGETVLELGCGVGTASLCLGARVPDLALFGVEILDDYVTLAQKNGVQNGQDFQVIQGDLTVRPTPFCDRSFDHVILNPPYFEAETSVASPDRHKASGRTLQAPLQDWIDVAAKRLRPKGTMTLIQRVEGLPAVLVAISGKLGSPILQPLSARPGRAPHLIVLRARKSGRAAFQMNAPIVLHQGEYHIQGTRQYTDGIEGVLRHAQALTW